MSVLDTNMVVSASRRTDIPAFFNEWFLSRMKSGHVVVKNPYNPRHQRRISLKRRDVKAFVFWTRWPRPFFPSLAYLDKMRIPYYLMITINRYPRLFEPDTPPAEDIEPVLSELALRIGPERIIWRYDPIILSSYTDLSFHKENFRRLTRMAAGRCRRVIVSYLDQYRKVTRRLKTIGLADIGPQRNTSQWLELNDLMLNEAAGAGLELQTCAEPAVSDSNRIPAGRCIDPILIGELMDGDLVYKKDVNQRKPCACHQSVDIGTYGTCGFHCVYCYAR